MKKKEKKKPEVKKIFAKIFSGNLPALIYLSVNHDRESFLKELKERFDIDEPEKIFTDAPGSVHMFTHEGRELFVLRMKDWTWEVSYNALLVHEVFHLAMETARSIGLHYNNDHNSEAFAYHIQHLYTEIANEIAELKK